MKEHINFDLWLEFRSGGVRSAASCPGSGGKAFGEEWDASLLQELCSFTPGASGKAREVQQAALIPSPQAKEVGGALFQALFSGEVKGLWRGQLAWAIAGKRDLRLRIHLDAPDLSGVPWEILFDPEHGFLALSRHPRISIVRYLGEGPEFHPRLRMIPMRILVVAAQPRGQTQLDVDAEWFELKRGLAWLRRLGLVRLKRLKVPTLSHLSEMLTREAFHVVHFIGHGGFDPTTPEGVLYFESDSGGEAAVSGLRLGAVLKQQESLGLVVLNACEGAREGAVPFTGVAESLVRQEIPSVVAMQHPVRDRDAIRFARRFYGELVRSGSVDSALSQARIGWMADSPESDWSTPVLYLRSPTGFKPGRLPLWLLSLVSSVLILAVVVFNHLREPDAPAEPPLPLLLVPLEISAEGCPPSDTLGMEFVRIPAGTFKMGSKPRNADHLEHPVTISRPFCMSAHEVTWNQWRRIMLEEASTGPPDGQLPVTGISWDDAQVFLERLGNLEVGSGYRLPTEAEWEYAARAGSRHPFSFGEDSSLLHLYGNCRSRGARNDRYDGLAPVGKFEPNRWGLYDMHGNASEWVQDWYAPYPDRHETDPVGAATGDEKVRRGGSFEIKAENCSAVFRNQSRPSYRRDDVGFRLVKPVVQEGT